MATLKMEQLKKWSSVLPEGWKFDATFYVMHGEKKIYIDSEEKENGVFYRLELDYSDERNGSAWYAPATGRKIPTATVNRYTPTGTGSFCSVVNIFNESAGEPENKKNYNVLVKIASSLNVAEYFAKAEEKDTGKQYNSISEFFEDQPAEAAETQEKPEEEQTEEQPAEEQSQEAPTATKETALSVGMSFEDAQGEKWTITRLDSLQVELNGGARSLYDFGTSRTVGAVLDALGTGSKLISDAKAEEKEPAKEPAETVQEPEAQAEETEETEQDQPKEAKPAPIAGLDYAALARGYFTGKSAKAPQPQPQPQPEPEKEPEPEPEPEPEKPYVIGFQENDNENGRFSAEDRAVLANGWQVTATEKFHESITFCCKYSENVRFLYRVTAHDRNGDFVPSASCNPSFSGLMIGSDYYSGTDKAAAKLSDDINHKLLELVPDEHTAAISAANVDEWEKEEIEKCKSFGDYYKKEAQELFYHGKKPGIYLYSNYRGHETDLVIKYMQNPAEVVETEALRFLCENAGKIYRKWIEYNAISKEYEDIKADPSREEHKFLKISHCVNEEKTVRVSLSNGNEVKVEADALKRLPFCGHISPWNVNAADRQFLTRNEYGRDGDINLQDILAVYHGGRVLYSA